MEVQEEDRHSASLRTAAWVGHSVAVPLLLSSNAEPDAPGSDGRRALWLASRAGHHDIVRLLVQAGANIEIAWGTDMDAPDEDAWGRNGSGRGLTPLAAASAKGRVEVVKVLIESGADINSAGEDDEGRFPLLVAARCSQMPIVRVLLNASAMVDLVSPVDGSTALGWAATAGSHVVVEALLAADASVNTSDHDGATPLHWAAGEGHLKVVQLLISARASLTMEDVAGCTPCCLAEEEGHTEIAQILERAKEDADLIPDDIMCAEECVEQKQCSGEVCAMFATISVA